MSRSIKKGPFVDPKLAKKIEDTIQWDPSKENSSLEGTPKEDQRFSYIKYDK